MLRDRILPLLTARFPGKFVVAESGVEPFVTFAAKHPEVGDVQIYDDGDEVTLVAGKFTHGHFSNYDDVPVEQKEQRIAEDILSFLDKLFADRVVLWGSHQGMGGWRVIDPDSAGTPKHRQEYVWSGPRNS